MALSEIIATLSATIAGLTFIVALGTLVKALFEYQRQNVSKRFEIFQGMNERFDAEGFAKIRELLDGDEPELAQFDYTLKHNFLAFYEEIALAVNSKIMNEDIAFYIFGYYAIRCWNSENFWSGDRMINKDSIYWSLFRTFARQMQAKQSALAGQEIAPERMRF